MLNDGFNSVFDLEEVVVKLIQVDTEEHLVSLFSRQGIADSGSVLPIYRPISLKSGRETRRIN